MIKALIILVAAQHDPRALSALITLRADMITCSAYYDVKEQDLTRPETTPRDRIAALGASRWHADQSARIAGLMGVSEHEHNALWQAEQTRLLEIRREYGMDPLVVVYEPMCEEIFERPADAFVNRMPIVRQQL